MSGHKTHTNRFCVVQENIKPMVLIHRPRKRGLYFEDLEPYIFLYNTKPVSMCILLPDWSFKNEAIQNPAIPIG